MVGNSIRHAIGKRAQQVSHAIGHLPFAQKPVRPIFVVGTGRCGTTLLVKIIASHPDFVPYQSEANDLWHPHSHDYGRRVIDTPPILFDPKEFTRCSLRSWTVERENAIRQIFSGFLVVRGFGRRLLLKSSMVSFMVRQLTLVFPDALFIHIYRSGPSVVASLVKKSLRSYNYLGDEATTRIYCARYWSLCLTELHRISQELIQKGQWLEFSYERLCAKPRGVLSEIGTYAGIDQDAFTFDLSMIQSQDWKVGDVESHKAWEHALNVMREVAVLKGYKM